MVKSVNSGHIALSGELTFATIPSVLADTKAQLTKKSQQWVLDLSAVEHSDSSGLALLLEFKRQAKRSNKSLKITNIPPQLLRIAEITGIKDLLVDHRE